MHGPIGTIPEIRIVSMFQARVFISPVYTYETGLNLTQVIYS